jgi:anhydro-N-acetylmuramic acid kinase
MKQEYYNVIGVMSGTSLDGCDFAHIEFSFHSKKWQFKIIETSTIPYTKLWLKKLKEAIHFSDEALTNLNQEYTLLLANMIKDFIAKQGITNLDAVCSHGHTILHQPQNGITLQIGNLPQLATLIQQKVVCDFRIQDVKLGGQGAPLVPIGDELLFPQYEYCMNLGGFSNISFLENNERIAFDISPVNTVLNFYANQVSLDYDDKGTLAKQGALNLNLLKDLNAVSYYHKKHPKSLGLEFVKETVLPIIESYPIKTEDKLRTFTEHIAQQIANSLPYQEGSLLITGGGAYNDFLIERIQNYLPNLRILIPSREIIEYKEALIFGLLGVLRLENKINILKSVTGATKNHSSGNIYEF